MKQSIRFWYACGIALCSYAAIRPTQALPVPDATLPNNSIVTNQGNISTITGGTRAGRNLFHSFSEFSVPTKGTAFFNNAVDIQNIISRVTGGSISNIDGLLRANGTANLFLINPNGIIFGPNASLNIGGSFLASTASSLKFADGTQFSATATQTTPLLTINVPMGLQFGANPGKIVVQGDGQGLRQTSEPIDTTAGLHVASNQTLAIVASDVELTGGTLKTAGGRIELGSVAGPSLVSLAPIDKGWALGYEGVQNFQNIHLSQQAAVDASGEGGGDIQVQGSRVTLIDGSQIAASTLGAGLGGTLAVRASDSVELIGTSTNGRFPGSLFAQTYSAATGTGSDLIIKTGRLIVRDGALVTMSSLGSGQAGNLQVQARSIQLDNLGGLIAETASGEGGNITLQAQDFLLLRHNSQISTSAFGSGNGGDITINTPFIVAVPSENSDITANAYIGKGGTVQISTQGVFGIQPQARDLSQSYISASSQFGINVLGINLTLGLVALPVVVPVDVTGLIAQGCPMDVGPRASKFVVTGRGGLPPTPREALRSEPPLVDLGTTVQGQENHASAATYTNATSSEPATIVEATGWVTNAKGEVVLIASAPSDTIQIPWITPATCHAQ